MKYTIVAALILVSGFMGAQSPIGGAACVNSIEVNGQEYTGKIKISAVYPSDPTLPAVDVTAYKAKEDNFSVVRLQMLPPMKK